jgi:hypothetical protein
MYNLIVLEANTAESHPSLYSYLANCVMLMRKKCRSQWARGLRSELSSPARIQAPWVRISLEAWKSVRLFRLCYSVSRQWAAPSCNESYRLCMRLRNFKKRPKANKRGCVAINYNNCIHCVQYVLYCLCSFVSHVLFEHDILCYMCIFVLRLIAVPLLPGKTPFAVKLNNNNMRKKSSIRAINFIGRKL